METIKDLFIQEKSYIVEYKLNDKYYLFIEALDEFDCAINGAFNIENGKYDFDEDYITDNILVELHEMNDYDNPVCEWYGCCKFKLDTTLEHLEKVMEYAIELYESDQGDE